jgi:DNA-binding transcriptional MerR regulator
VSTLLTIGEFSRATHLSVKALRHYDDIGLLQPAAVDPSSGYRHYASAQIPSAQVIRRFRDLDMPLDEIRLVLQAPDVDTRDRAIVSHLTRMEDALARTQTTVASLRELLDGGSPTLPVEFRHVASTRAVVVRDSVAWESAEEWLVHALLELRTIVDAEGVRAGPEAALYSAEFFEAHQGELTAFIPISADPPLAGPFALADVPGADLAITVHEGPFADIDRAYAALGTYVTERAIGAAGPIREHYLVTPFDTTDPNAFRTEVAWPVTALVAS